MKVWAPRSPCHLSQPGLREAGLFEPLPREELSRDAGGRGGGGGRVCTGCVTEPEPPPVGVKGNCWISSIILQKVTEDTVGRGSEEDKRRVGVWFPAHSGRSSPHGVLTQHIGVVLGWTRSVPLCLTYQQPLRSPRAGDKKGGARVWQRSTVGLPPWEAGGSPCSAGYGGEEKVVQGPRDRGDRANPRRHVGGI